MTLKKVIKKLFNTAGYELLNLKFEALKKQQLDSKGYKRIMDILPAVYESEKDSDLMWNFISFAGKQLKRSKSQIMQDLFVLFVFGKEYKGFFVEFGATDGHYLSNTFLLEKELGWKGILSEPAKVWHQNLYKNRACTINTSCVWSTTGDKLLFSETVNPEISTVSSMTESDSLSKSRKQSIHYEVETISLNDLLLKSNAPKFIEYISLDTEGSEYEILSAFDFSKYQFGLITVEHNFSTNRDKIYDLLHRNGYTRIFEPISQYDDWYLNNELYLSLQNNQNV